MSYVLSVDPKVNAGTSKDGVQPPNSETPKGVAAGLVGGSQSVENADVAAMNNKFNELNKKYEELKSLARDGKKKGEVAKHRKPQIKRSIGFLWDMKHGIDDVKEGVQTVIDWIFNEKPLNTDDVLKLKDRIGEIEELIDNEMEANEIASASKFGWGTLKYYENYSVFKGREDCEKKTQRFHAAEGKARGAYNNRSWSGKNRGRSNFYGGSSPSRQSNVHSYSNFNDRKRKFNDFNPINVSEMICFKCNAKGHMRKDCPKN